MPDKDKRQTEQLLRLVEANISFNAQEDVAYLNAPDEHSCAANDVPPPGYKRCGRCRKVLKLYLFNRNKSSSLNCSGNCKDCQRATSKKHYDKVQAKRNWKEYYAKNKERKREHAREYYKNNKEKVDARHRAYLKTAKGKQTMQKAHAKRNKAMAETAGVPYTRDIVIQRETDSEGHPICYLCGKVITVDSNLHVEHVIPIVLGGADCFTNVACAHQLCNLQKSKDAREIPPELVEEVIKRAEKFIDNHPELF